MGPHVLIVEDDALVADVIVAALEADYATSLAETSAAALQILADRKVDLMLLDCTLPDGIDPDLIPAADAAGVPVVLMSGDPKRAESLTKQPRPFLLKPFTLTELVAALRREIGDAAPSAV